MEQRIKAWSFSRYKEYDTCPAKAKYKFIDKLKEPPAPAMERGTDIHKKAEDYVRGTHDKLPAELARFTDQFCELRRSKPRVEMEWAFTRDWAPTGWFEYNAWLRVKTDALCRDDDLLYIIDYKTGKPKPDHPDQLSLYAIAGCIMYPEVKQIDAQLWYIDSGEMSSRRFSIEQIPTYQAEWEEKVQPMLQDTRFSPKPGNHCRWCTFSRSKGGPCKY